MRVQTALRTIMKRHKVSQLTISKLGNVSQTTVSSALKNNSHFDTYVSILDAIGYEIIIQPKHRGTLGEDKYAIGLEDEPEAPVDPKVGWYAPAK